MAKMKYAHIQPRRSWRGLLPTAAAQFRDWPRLLTIALLAVAFGDRLSAAPVITVQPQPRTVVGGSPMTFSAVATGTAPLSYRWQFAGRPIPGATNASYAITSVTASDAGAYELVVSDTGGSTISSKVSLAVVLPPSIVTHPVSSGATLGATAMFSVRADGTAPVSYQWYRSGMALSGATASSLTVDPVSFSDEGLYNVRVANWATRINSLDAGSGHSAYIQGDSLLVTGYNTSGQLGDGTITNRSTPVKVAGGVASVSAGGSHTMFINNDEALWAMGGNLDAQLGDGTTTSRRVPVKIASGVASVSAGRSHTMFVKTDGTLWGMGSNYSGQLGDGSTTSRSTPVQVASGVASVSAGGSLSVGVSTLEVHTMFVKTDGTLWAMGNNKYGQLGDGTTTNRGLPVKIASGVASVSAGWGYTMFIKADGTLWGIGSNSSFQLGDGTTTSRSTPVQVASGVASVSAGERHTMFIKTDGTLWAMGSNSSFQLGDGTTTSRSTPVQVASGVASVSAGSGHTMFVKTDGMLSAIGSNDSGQLGDGTTTSRSTPEQIVFGFQSDSAFLTIAPFIISNPNPQAIGVGETAIFTVVANGTAPAAYQWRKDGAEIAGATTAKYFVESALVGDAGDYDVVVRNSAGSVSSVTARMTVIEPPLIVVQPESRRLVSGRNVTFSAEAIGPSPLYYHWYRDGADIPDATGVSLTINPVQPSDAGLYTLGILNTSNKVRQVSSGSYGTTYYLCGVTLWAMGYNSSGQLGDGTRTNRSVPMKIASGVGSVSAGSRHAMFIKTDGTLWGMGYDKDGQLGAGSKIDRIVPVEIASGVASVSAGSSHTMFVKTDGTLWGMGSNSQGQSGVSYTTSLSTPVQVASAVASVSAGVSHTMFIKTDGTLWAIGYNVYGQLGDGTTTSHSTPVQVATGIASVSAGGSHTMFVKTDGTLWAMGSNYYGQLGDGSKTNRSVPVKIASGVGSVSAGSSHTMFVKTDGTLWAMGYNVDGQLGNGTTTSRSTPVQVASGVASVSAASSHTMFVKTDGRLWAMGGNFYGQLGDGTTSDRASPFATFKGVVSAAIFLAPPPVIVFQPQSQTVAVGLSGALFGVQAQSVASLYYQWRKNGVPILGETSSSYSIGNVVEGDSGRYEVVVRDFTGEDFVSATAQLTAAIPPVIVNQPVSRELLIGQSGLFVVNAAGTAPLSYQWYRAGIPLLGNTSSILQVNSMQASDASIFAVGVVNGANMVKQASAGYAHSAFLRGGVLLVMGSNGSEQLGYVFAASGLASSSSTPVTLGNYGVMAVSAGASHTMVLKADGTLWGVGSESGWGYEGTTGAVRIKASGVSSVAAGSGYTMFIKTDETLWAMGSSNGYGQFGDGTTTGRSTPVQVASGVASVSASVWGYGTTTFIKTDGTLWAMGNNDFGQLGDGTTTSRSTPVQVASGVASVSAGAGHTMFIKTDGTLWAMGENGDGQLGDGTTTRRSTPVQVASGVASVSAASSHTMFVKTDGTLWGMGNNSFFQLGDGTTTRRSTPVQVASGVASVSAGVGHTMFIKTDGTLWAMGKNGSGQLGDGTYTDRSRPVGISLGTISQAAYLAERPTITSQPQPWLGSWGQAVRFATVATSTAPLSYQWRKDGVSLPGATNTSFSIAAGTGPDAGVYDVIVSNQAANVASSSAPLRFFQSVTFDPLPAKTFGDSVFSADATASSGLAVSYASSNPAVANVSGVTVTIVGAGTATITASQAGNGTYAAATEVQQTLVVGRASQSITFGMLATKAYGDAPFSLTTTASSGLPVSYASSNPAVATVNGNTVTIVGLGSTTITASQVGNSNYNPATNVNQTLNVVVSPSITTQPVARLAGTGTGTMFAVVANGTAALSYQWKKNGTTLADGGTISGATTATLSLSNLTTGDVGNYTVVVANAGGTATSNAATLTVVDAQATHAVVGSGYIAGGTVTLTQTLTFSGSCSGLRWQILLPTGWSYASGGGSQGDVKPSAGATSLLEWAWTSVPVSPITFTVTLNVPVGETGDRNVTALSVFRVSAGAADLLVTPDPLAVSQVTTHSADADRNFRISLVELTRVIQIYNTRNGTNRTGCYAVQAGTEDGFGVDAARAASATVTLGAYHSADSDHNGKISLFELTRVIELYNYRTGTTRTGQYHIALGSEDGFEPGW